MYIDHLFDFLQKDFIFPLAFIQKEATMTQD